jgi:hypothetical protein
VSDPFLVALREYELAIAAPTELMRRAKARLREQLRALLDKPLDEDDRLGALFANGADPTEPDGAQYAVEAALAHAEVAQEAEPVLAPAEASAAAYPPADGGSSPPLRSIFDPPSGGEAHPEPVVASVAPAPAPAGPVAVSDAVRAKGPYPCPDCGREFPLPQNVGRHRKYAHAAPSPTAEPTLLRVHGDHPAHFCFRCQEGFESGEALREHRRSPRHQRAGGGGFQ